MAGGDPDWPHGEAIGTVAAGCDGTPALVGGAVGRVLVGAAGAEVDAVVGDVVGDEDVGDGEDVDVDGAKVVRA